MMIIVRVGAENMVIGNKQSGKFAASKLFLENTRIIRHICIFIPCLYISNYVQNNCASNEPKFVLIHKVLKKIEQLPF